MSGYFANIEKGIKTTLKGMKLTFQHLVDARKKSQPVDIQSADYFSQGVGIVTLQYPHETMQIPDNGRYQLDCEIDDCIVCDKCAKVCPVDCIEIEAIKSPELIAYASDGSPIRLHAAKFDIDMAKCCFCGLCTTVCPTECLTMNSEYDYSSFDVRNMNFAFSNLSEEQADEKRKLYEQFVAEKQSKVSTQKSVVSEQSSVVSGQQNEVKPVSAKPVFKPSFKNKTVVEEPKKEEEVLDNQTVIADISEQSSVVSGQQNDIKPVSAKPVFKPSFKNKTVVEEPKKEEQLSDNQTVIADISEQSSVVSGQQNDIKPVSAKPVFKPTFKKTNVVEEPKKEEEVPDNQAVIADDKPKARPVFKPTFKK